MKQTFKYSLPLLIAALVAFGMFVGAKFGNGAGAGGGTGNSRQKIEEVLRYVNSSYVDKPDGDKMSDAAIEAMLKELDPHSVYIPAKEVAQSTEQLEGNFEGIGVEFNIISDTITVVSPISGGPSEQVGIRSGDRIIKIEGKTVAGVKFGTDDVVKSLRGNKGTKVNISIKRSGEAKLLDFTVTRDKIPIYSVDASYMASPEIGYIKINRFGATTMKEFREAFARLKGEGMKSLVLDLRNNPGGYLQTAIELADEFIDDNKLIVYTQGRARKKEVYKSGSNGLFEKGRLAVMIDEGSASASEIVSGALQDQDRAVVIGRRSFGKGLVQEPFQLSDGSALRLTVARYYTPSGRSIQRPYDKGAEDYYDMASRYKHGELLSKDSIHFSDSLKFYTSGHRLVYGGGGIMPDLFVPLDTTENSAYFQKLYGKNVFSEYILDYADRNQKNLNANYKDFASFRKSFTVDANMMAGFVAFGVRKGVKEDPAGLKVSGKYLRIQLKALLARQLFRNDAFYEILNEDNPAYQKALEVLRDNKEYTSLKISE